MTPTTKDDELRESEKTPPSSSAKRTGRLDKPGPEESPSEKPASQKALSEKVPSEKPASEGVLSEKPASEKPASERALSEKPASEKAPSQKAPSEKSAGENPSREKAAREKSASVKPVHEKATEAEHANGGSTPNRPAGRGQFTPSFTLLGSGPAASKEGRANGAFAPGSTFGVYVVGECIGEGGMARIYRAEHAGLRRQVALKVLIDGFAKDVAGRERFLREARLAAAIKHPNVVNIFDVGVQDDIPYLVMELLEGQDLEKLLQSKGAIDENLIVDIMIPVVAGLSAVHDAGIVHRDLKPGNVFLATGRYGEVEPKLLDFGISKAQGPEQLKLTANRGILGTPFYISPECLHGRETSPLSDQYSLGVVMYECLTGSTPYKASAFNELSRLIVSGQYAPLNLTKSELARRLGRIIERAMSLEPEHRYGDLREMGRELLALAGQRTRITWGLTFGEGKRDAHPESVRGTGAGQPLPPAQPPPHRRDPWPAFWAGLGAVVLLVLVAWGSGMVSFHPAGRAPVVSAPADAPVAKETSHTETTARAQAVLPGLAPAPAPVPGPAPVPAAPAPVPVPGPLPTAALPAPADVASAAPAADSAWRPIPRPEARPEPPAPPALRHLMPVRSPAPVVRHAAAKSDSDNEDWAFPAANAAPSAASVQLGPNGAPIFD